MSPLVLVAVGLVLVVATCLQASIGFGMGLLAAPVIAVIDPSLLPASVIMLAIVVTAVIAAMEHASLDLRGAGWALLGRVPGSLLGACLVAAMPLEVLSWLVAVTVLVGVVVSLRGWAPRVTRTSQIVAGAASGLMGTTTSIGGAPMALVWQRSEGPRLRGTMAAFFLVGSCVSLVALAAWGTIGRSTLLFFAQMLPAVVVGIVLSRFVNRFLDRRRTRAIALLAASAGALLLAGTQAAALLT